MGFLALDVVRHERNRRRSHVYAGGTCGNVLAILAYMGWDAYPIARLNGDCASQSVKKDLLCVGVKLSLAELAPTVNTPIVVQVIGDRKGTRPQHTFEWACPECGTALPRFRPVPTRAVPMITQQMDRPSVFFMDRVSRSSLAVATVAARRGALVYFEPSDMGDPRLFSEALQVAHILKYSKERLTSLKQHPTQTLIEIQTLGARGLRYRRRLSRGKAWSHLPAVTAPKIIDSCGAGDWCSAGFLHQIGMRGSTGVVAATDDDVVEALRFGQALAAWNCGFEGARGGMYKVTHERFTREVRAILGADAALMPQAGIGAAGLNSPLGTMECPSCGPRRLFRASSSVDKSKA